MCLGVFEVESIYGLNGNTSRVPSLVRDCMNM
jgi:hypothetical protein